MTKLLNKTALNDLTTLRKELESYRKLLHSRGEPSESLIRRRDKLREKIIPKAIALKPIITERTPEEYVTRTGVISNMWNDALDAYPSLSLCDYPLKLCIEATDVASGKLESDIEIGLEYESEELVDEATRIDLAAPPPTDTEEPQQIDITEPPPADTKEPQQIDITEPPPADTKEPQQIDITEPPPADTKEPQQIDAEEPQRIDIAEPPGDTALALSSLFDQMRFHPRVVAASKSLFETGHYAQAIFEAFKAVDNSIKEKAIVPPNCRVLSKVFNENAPIIKLNELLTQSDQDETKDFRFLFMGAMVGIRNLKTHKTVVQKDPYLTLEYLGLASLLLKRLDSEKVD